MSQGERAAEQTKGFFKNASRATESLRQNINSFADDLVGSKSGSHSNSADTATSHNVDQPTTTTSISPGTAGLSAQNPMANPSPPSGTMGVSDASAGTHVGTHNTGLTGGGTSTGAHTTSGIHPDAERLGSGVVAAVDDVREKVNPRRDTTKNA